MLKDVSYYFVMVRLTQIKRNRGWDTKGATSFAYKKDAVSLFITGLKYTRVYI